MDKDNSDETTPLTFGSILSFSSLTSTEAHDSYIYIDGFVKKKLHMKFVDPLDSKLMYSKCLFQVYPTFVNTSKKNAASMSKKEKQKRNPKPVVSSPNTPNPTPKAGSQPIDLGKSKTRKDFVQQEQKRIEMINDLQEKMMTEFKFNHETFKKVAGQPLYFGQPVQFLHIASNKFLCCKDKEAELERENYTLTLAKYSTDDTVFRFLPSYKHQKESEGIIYINDIVYISSSNLINNKTPYIHVSNPMTKNMNKAKLANFKHRDTSAVATGSKKKIKIEINASLDSHSRLKLNYFSGYHDSNKENYLAYGDVVWLNHSELGATLVCVAGLQDNMISYNIEFDLSKHDEEFAKFEGNTNGMWIVENQNYFNGGIVEWSHMLRFRHLSSGLYLSVKKIKVKGESKMLHKLVLDNRATEDNLFKFVPVSNASSNLDQYVGKDSFVLVYHNETKKLVHGNFEREDVSAKTMMNEETTESGLFAMITPILKSEREVGQEAAFKLIKASFNEIWETSFLISCFPLLKKFLEQLIALGPKNPSDKDVINYMTSRMKVVQRCVIDLDLFCNNKLYSTSQDQKYGEINPFRQKLLREQFFIDIIARILKELINKQDFDTLESTLAEKSTFIESPRKGNISSVILGNALEEAANRKNIIKTHDKLQETEAGKFLRKKIDFAINLYTLVRSICKNNYENEIYTFSLVPHFLLHCKYISPAVDCVISIIKGNEFLLNKMNENIKMDIDRTIGLKFDANIISIVINIRDESHAIEGEKRIDPTTIITRDKNRISKPINFVNFFLNLLKEGDKIGSNYKYLTFLKSIAMKNHQAVTINQDLLHRIFNENKKFSRTALINFDYDEAGALSLDFPSSWKYAIANEPITIEDYMDNIDNDNPDHFFFIEEQLNLFSSLSYGRNFLWTAELKSKFPDHFIFRAIWDTNLSKSLRASFCMLALTLHVDQEPFNAKNPPLMCRNYEETAPEDQPPAERRKTKLKTSAYTRAPNKQTLDAEMSELIDKIAEFLQTQTSQMKTKLKMIARGDEKKFDDIMEEIDLTTDILLMNVVQLFNALLKFDILKMLNKQKVLYKIVNNFVSILEYDEKNSIYAVQLEKLREDNFTKKMASNKSKQLMSMLKSTVGTFIDVGELGGMFGGKDKEIKKIKKPVLESLEDQDFYNNPIMRSMLTLNYVLERMKYDEEKRKGYLDIEIKLEICDTLDYLMNLRIDYLISNFMGYYAKLGKRIKKYENKLNYYTKLAKKIHKSFRQVLPPVSKTGLFDIDVEISTIKTKTTDQLQGMFSSKNKNKLKFFDFIDDENERVPDLDTLLLGDRKVSNDMTSEVLPSLLISFATVKDSKLERRFLDLIMRLFNQRTELVSSLSKLEVLFDANERKTCRYIEKLTEKLKLSTEKMEIWLSEYIKDQSKDSEIMETIESLDDLINLFLPDNYFDGNTVRSSSDDWAKVSSSRQNIMRYLETFKPVLTITKDGLHNLNKILLDTNYEVDIKKTLVKLFQRTHFFLELFCQNNDFNQKLLVEYQDIFVSFAHLDLGQIDLLSAIYRNNRNLCLNIKDSFLRKFIMLIHNEGRQAKFLKFFMVIQKCQDTYLSEIQIRVLKQFTDTQDKSFENASKTLYGFHNKAEDHFQFQFDDYFAIKKDETIIDRLKDQGFRDTYRDEPFLYHCQLLDVLMETIKGSKNFNLSKAKLKKLFTVGYLLSIAVHPDTLSDLDSTNMLMDNSPDILLKAYMKRYEFAVPGSGKRQDGMPQPSPVNKETLNEMKIGFSRIKARIVRFMMELYFVSNTNIAQDISDQYKQFLRLIDREILRIELIATSGNYDPGFIEYFFGALLPVFNQYIAKSLNENTLKENPGRRDNSSFFRLSIALKSALPKFKDNLTYDQINNVRTFMESYIENIYSIEDEIRDLAIPAEERSPGKKEKKPAQTNTTFQTEPNIVWGANENWERVLELITIGNPKWKEAVDQEKIALSDAFLSFEKYFPDDKDSQKTKLESKDLIKKLIKFLQYGLANNAKKETMISTLQTLIQMIEKPTQKEKEEIQNMLNRYDATKMLLIVLSDASNLTMDFEVFNNFLLLGIKLLEGGNHKIQKTIYHYFITFQRSEVFFAKIHNILTTEIQKLTKRNNEKIYDPSEAFTLFHDDIIQNILRLLQLFTEGHYLDLQNYLRHQFNSRNSYDIVSTIVDLARAYLSQIKRANYDSIIRCFDTLIEFVQGPCPENQACLVEGKFFEVAHHFLNINEEVEEEPPKNKKSKIKKRRSAVKTLTFKEQRIIDMTEKPEPWMLERIRYKAVVLIMSLLEMRREDAVTKKVIRSLPSDILKKAIVSVWKKYKQIYGLKYVKDSLNHFDGDPSQEKNPKKKKKYNVILETGFTIYFLLENFYNNIGYDPDYDVMREVKAKKSKEKKSTDSLEDNLIGQLGKFGLTLVHSTLKSARDISKEAGKRMLQMAQLAKEDKEEEKRKMKQQFTELLREALKFFAEHSAHIEVKRHHKLEKVYFIMLPFCHSLPKEVKKDFHDNVERVSVQSKINGLVQASESIIRTMQHEEVLKIFFEKNQFLALFAQYVSLWKDIAFLLTIILNLFVLASFEVATAPEGSSESEYDLRMNNPTLFALPVNRTQNLFDILGIIMSVCAVFVVLFFLIKRAPLIVEKAWKFEVFGQDKKKKISLFNWILSIAFKIIYTAFSLLRDFDIVYYVAYGLFAVLGVVIHQFFYAFHLTQVILKYPTLRDVIRSFWVPKVPLGLTFVLFIIFEWIFTLFGFYFFHDQYTGFCESTIHCFLYTFDYTFKANAGIGGQLDGLYPKDPGLFPIGRFLFDNLFNVILLLIMVSIVAGIIIDTFGNLREEENDKRRDLNEVCFICGNERDQFDRRADIKGGFRDHIKVDHYMWNYVFYIAYLKFKPYTEYTGIESFVSKKIKEGDLSWFPLHKAISLESAVSEESKQMQKLKEMQENIDDVKKTARELEVNFGKLIRKFDVDLK